MTTTADDLEKAQEQLGSALEHARAGEDKELGSQVREAGEGLVRGLVALMRLAGIHSPENAAFEVPLREMAAAMRRLELLLGAVHLVCVEGQVYVNDIRVRMDERLGFADELGRALGRHHCGGLTFNRPLDEAEIRRIFPVVAREPAKENPLSAFRDAITATGLDVVAASGRFRLRFTGEDAPTATQEDIHKTMARAENVVTEAWGSMAAARVPNPVPVRRLVNDLVDASRGHAEWFGEAEETLWSPTAEAYAAHSLRVCSLALVIGRELGLSETSLADLGVAAVYHDSGYATTEDGVPPSYEHHTTAGMRKLLRQRGFHQAKVKRLLVAIEHHREHADKRGRPTLYARIVKIADDFENYTRRRPGGAFYSPPEALGRMAFSSGTVYDPVLLQLFINRVGAYPPGTLLRLKDGRVVVTVSGARSPDLFDKPLCRLVYAEDGSSPGAPTEVDLAAEGKVAEVVAVRRVG